MQIRESQTAAVTEFMMAATTHYLSDLHGESDGSLLVDVIDRDSIRVMLDGTAEQIRLFGIGCHEKSSRSEHEPSNSPRNRNHYSLPRLRFVPNTTQKSRAFCWGSDRKR